MEEQSRNWSGQSRRYGSLGTYGAWDEVLDLYYEDRVEEAFEAAVALGAWPNGETYVYRMVEAEALARSVSRETPLSGAVALEHPEGWESDELRVFGEAVLAGVTDVQERMGVWEAFPVKVTLLPREVDAPWTPGRDGFMVDKTPFDKICLPLYLSGRRKELEGAVRHEYAHVVCLNLSEGRVPTWLDEAMATTMGRDRNPAYRDRLRRGVVKWAGPEELSEWFHTDRRTGPGAKSVVWAYAQAWELGRALVERGGEGKLADLLRGFGDNSTWQELWMRVKGQTAEDEAMREVYGVGVEEFFELVRGEVGG